MKFSSFVAIAIMLFLGACQTSPKKKLVDGSAQWHQDADYFDVGAARVDALQQWRYSAKVAITSPAVREVANIVWQYQDQSNDVRLFGPLGIGAVNLQFDQFGVVLSDNSGVRHQGDSAQELLTNIVGWPIPIDALSRWLHVLPTKNAVYRYQLNGDGSQLTVLEQLGWRIQYSAYRQYGEGVEAVVLPRKIVASKTLPGGSKLQVKLVTKAWKM